MIIPFVLFGDTDGQDCNCVQRTDGYSMKTGETQHLNLNLNRSPSPRGRLYLRVSPGRWSPCIRPPWCPTACCWNARSPRRTCPWEGGGGGGGGDERIKEELGEKSSKGGGGQNMEWSRTKHLQNLEHSLNFLLVTMGRIKNTVPKMKHHPREWPRGWKTNHYPCRVTMSGA